MKINIDTKGILEQLTGEIKEKIDYLVDTEIRSIIRGEIYDTAKEEMDHIEETPYNIIHHRVYAMLDKYIEKEVEERIINQSDQYRKLKELCDRAEECSRRLDKQIMLIDGVDNGDGSKGE